MRRPERCASLPEGQGEHREARLEGNFRQEIDCKGIPPSPQIDTSSFERIAPRGREAVAFRKMACHLITTQKP
jgi:hypothetical protein